MPIWAAVRIGALWILMGSRVEGQTLPDTLHLTLAEARTLAVQGNPDLLAARLAVPVALGELRQAGVYPLNPQLDADLTTGRVPEGEQREYSVGLAQEVELGGQRGLRIQAARSGLRAAGLNIADTQRQTLAAVSGEYLSALGAGRQLALARQILDLNEQLLSAAQRQLEAGAVSGLELNLAQIEVGRARTRLLRAESDRGAALLRLQRELGLPESRIPVPVEEKAVPALSLTLDVDSLVRQALSRRPDVASLASQAAQAEAQARLARRAGLPNLTVRAFEEAQNGEPARLNVGLGVPFPLFNRNQGTAASLSAQADQLRLQQRALETRVRSEVEVAFRAFAAATRTSGVFERDVLAPLRENQALLETAYRAGKIGLAEVLLIRNQLFETEAEYGQARLARETALIDLETAAGLLTSPSQNPQPRNR